MTRRCPHCGGDVVPPDAEPAVTFDDVPTGQIFEDDHGVYIKVSESHAAKVADAVYFHPRRKVCFLHEPPY